MLSFTENLWLQDSIELTLEEYVREKVAFEYLESLKHHVLVVLECNAKEAMKLYLQ